MISCLFQLWLIRSIHSETILQSYTEGEHWLRAAESPYVVTSNVAFHAKANVVIENGVKIIFVDNNCITVFGSLNSGCTDTASSLTTGITTNSSTSAYDHVAGLSDPTHFVHLVGNASLPTSVGIFINQKDAIPSSSSSSSSPPRVQFCNTLFENTQSGIRTSEQYRPLTADHCEFRSLNNAIEHSAEGVVNVITHSYFHGINHVKSNDHGPLVMEHCLFERFRQFGEFEFAGQSAPAHHIAVRHSEINGHGVPICLDVASVTGVPELALYDNHIHHCQDGIRVSSLATDGRVPIRNNTISDCSRHGVYALDTTAALEISSNHFVGNLDVDIKLESVQRIEIEDNLFSDSMEARLGEDDLDLDDDDLQWMARAAVWIEDGQSVDVRSNGFASLKRQNVLQFVRCSNVTVADNDFEDVVAGYGLLEMDAFVTANISGNVFSRNAAEFVMHLDGDRVGDGEAPERGEEPTNASLSNNKVTGNMVYSMADHGDPLRRGDLNYLGSVNKHHLNESALFGAVHIANTEWLKVNENVMAGNTVSGPLLWIDGVFDGHVKVHENTFQDNTVDVALWTATAANSVATTSEDLVPSPLLEAEGALDLLYLPSPYTTIVSNNHFVDNLHFERLLHLNYLDKAYVTSIEYNTFLQRLRPPGPEATTYIHIAGDGGNPMDECIPSIHVNNFYNSSNVEHFISTDTMDIDANNNYFDGLMKFYQISDKIGDFCTGDGRLVGMAGIERVNEDPVFSDHDVVLQCSWNFVNCSAVSNYHCKTVDQLVSPTPRITSSPVDASEEEVSPHPDESSSVQSAMESESKGGSSMIVIVVAVVGALLVIVCCEKVYSCWRHNHTPKRDRSDKRSRHHLSFSDGHRLSIQKKTMSMTTEDSDYGARVPMSSMDPVDTDEREYEHRLSTMSRPHDYHPRHISRHHITHLSHISNYPFGRVLHRHDMLDGDDDADSSTTTEVYVDDHEDAPILSLMVEPEGDSHCPLPQQLMSPSGDGDEFTVSTSQPPRHTMVHHGFGEMMNHDEDFVVGSGSSEHSEHRLRTSTLCGYRGPGHSHHSVTVTAYDHSRNEGVLGHDEFVIRGSLEDAATTAF